MKTDHRKRYTKKVIQEAFLSLLRQKPVEKITISDVCALAEISRPTFYLHYESISALLEEIGNELIASANLPEIAALVGCWIGRGERRESADQLAEIIEGFLLFGLSGCVG